MISLIPIRCRKPCKIIKALYSSGGCFRIEPCDSCTKRKTVLYLIAYNHKFTLAGIALRKALTVKLITNPDFLALEVRIQTLHPRISRINYATDFYLIRTKIGFVPLNLPAAICPIRTRTIVTPFTLNVDFLYTYYIM